MKINMKRAASLGLFIFAVTSLMFFGSGSASADSNHHNDHKHHNHDHRDHHNRHDHERRGDQPRLDRGITVTKSTAALTFRDHRFRNQTVDVVVSVKNNSTKALVEKQYRARLDGDGVGSVTVKGLKSGTSYDFKVRILKSNDRTTDNSSDREATTM